MQCCCGIISNYPRPKGLKTILIYCGRPAARFWSAPCKRGPKFALCTGDLTRPTIESTWRQWAKCLARPQRRSRPFWLAPVQVLKRPAQISRRHPRQSLATSSVARGRRSRWARHAWRAAATGVVALPRHMRKGLANPAASEATHASRHAESNSQKSKGAALARPQWPVKFVRDEISAPARAIL